MKKSSLWAIYCRKYPQFAKDGEITLTTKGLRKFFDTTWDAAFYDGEPEKEDSFDHYSDISPESQETLENLRKLFGM
jgi:cold shock CspA family protein